MEYCFFEKIVQHKAILIKLGAQQQHYEVLTMFAEYQYLNSGDRKPNFYLSGLQKCTQKKIPLKDLTQEAFLAVLQRMNFIQSSEERYKMVATFAE